MVLRTCSATEPDRVMVEPSPSGLCSDVWLRANIREDAADHGPDGSDSVKFWWADEVHFVLAGSPSVEYVESQFESLWSEHKSDGLGYQERISQLEQQIADANDALIELGDLIGGDE